MQTSHGLLIDLVGRMYPSNLLGETQGRCRVAAYRAVSEQEYKLLEKKGLLATFMKRNKYGRVKPLRKWFALDPRYIKMIHNINNKGISVYGTGDYSIPLKYVLVVDKRLKVRWIEENGSTTVVLSYQQVRDGKVELENFEVLDWKRIPDPDPIVIMITNATKIEFYRVKEFRGCSSSIIELLSKGLVKEVVIKKYGGLVSRIKYLIKRYGNGNICVVYSEPDNKILIKFDKIV